ncbi:MULTISPECIES: ABC transporter permease subunit [unclassified Oceanobacter]|jgi:putrescine transport system permease protein|uniref:ABC transporter permease subunit n=1 Tax=unclassified Oceanobacter TaxID=2620260 RepID=UPI0026E37BD8|nr:MULTISPECIES: ABC transporter permease subunit [unclassified Oceanobacter]MDO6682687.1 ABC transporter permease subunit [Oceanobacter sp. 5_MG-2023]MDP2549355.1 ABC transporter permease subunit [Oceanobacter sp. 4_MG-2023]MDP2609094.1 ABC transporter permease subunit [Oceanobacter sp. 1_MG-2023]MDP2612416.1 ABC transporter permease subunit [Oceanobacter sp. 2_MG-2023]
MSQANGYTAAHSRLQRVLHKLPLKRINWGRQLVISMPFVWLAVFFFVPFLVVFKISLSETAIAIPPYTALIELEDALLNIKLNLGNYLFLWEDSFYLEAYLSSIRIAGVSTLLALIIGFPMAYLIARSESRTRTILLALVILPFWTSFLLRVYAWVGLLKKNGLVNDILINLGIVSEPIQMLQTDFAVYIGIVYTYLPFMILPLYTALEKMDMSLLEAAEDLGCRPFQSFFLVTIPLAMPGILAGCTLVFIPAVGEYVIPALLGGSDTLMIGRVLWDEFSLNRDWPMASAVATVMLVVLVLPIMLLRNRKEAE